MFDHLLLKLGGGGRHTCNMKGVSMQARVHGGGSLPPLEIGKNDAVRGNFNLFHLCFAKEIMEH